MKTRAHAFKGDVSESEWAAADRHRGPFWSSFFQLGLQPGLELRTFHLPAQPSPAQPCPLMVRLGRYRRKDGGTM